MKLVWMITVMMVACSTVSAEVSKDRLKELKRLVKIASVRDYEEGNRTNKKHMLKVEFSSESEGLEEIHFRIAVELTDKKAKQAYLVKKMRPFGDLQEGYDGQGDFELSMPYGDLEKLKVTAYVVQFGVMDDSTFIPFLTEYDDVESYDELMERTSKAFPNNCKLIRMVLVDR